MDTDINGNARAMLQILDDPSLYLVDAQGHAYPANGSYNGSMYRNYANAGIVNNTDVYGYLSQMRFGPKSAAYLDDKGIWMLMPPELIQSGASRATYVPAPVQSVPLPVQNQQNPNDGYVFGGSAPSPILPNNTPNPVPMGTISPGANANAQDAQGGSTQSGSGGSQDIWDMVINGPNGGGGANSNGAGGGIDSKVVLYGLVALVALLAVSK